MEPTTITHYHEKVAKEFYDYIAEYLGREEALRRTQAKYQHACEWYNGLSEWKQAQPVNLFSKIELRKIYFSGVI